MFKRLTFTRFLKNEQVLIWKKINVLHRSVSLFSCVEDLNALLFGSDAFRFWDDKEVFLLVHSFIKESKKKKKKI